MGSPGKDWRKTPPPISCGPSVRGKLPSILAVLLSAGTAGEEARPPQETRLDVHSFRVVESYSGPVSYYKIVEDPEQPFIRAIYRPPPETVTLRAEVADALRQRTERVRWTGRGQVLPQGVNECKEAGGDAAGVAHGPWKRGVK